jgi:hypothetical protein
MMKNRVKAFAPVLLILIAASVYPQSSSGGAQSSGAFDMSGFPLWSKDLRRAEIIALGSFPFTFFFATAAMDLYRSANHGWDSRYYPWPAKPAGAVPLTLDEHITVIEAAAAASALVALADFIIVQYKRHKAEEAAAALPPGSPIIIRRPLGGGGDTDGALPPEQP